MALHILPEVWRRYSNVHDFGLQEFLKLVRLRQLTVLRYRSILADGSTQAAIWQCNKLRAGKEARHQLFSKENADSTLHVALC